MRITPPIGYNQTTFTKEELRDATQSAVGIVEVNRMLSAYEMAESVHQYQLRNDGTPYIWHPARVAKIVVTELGITDPDTIITALLHDTLEDSEILTTEVLEYNFGSRVARHVELLTKEIRIKDGPIRERIDREYAERLHTAPTVCRLIKLADRLDNTRCLQFNLKRNPYKYVVETKNHYLPMADETDDLRVLYLAREIRQAMNKYFG